MPRTTLARMKSAAIMSAQNTPPSGATTDGSPVSRLEAEVRAWCARIADDPAARYQARVDFYARYGDGNELDREGYGRSELAFMRWEMTGRLKAPDADPPGSPWWSAVNLHFIYLSELGARAHQQGIPKDQLPLPSQRWIDYIL